LTRRAIPCGEKLDLVLRLTAQEAFNFFHQSIAIYRLIGERTAHWWSVVHAIKAQLIWGNTKEGVIVIVVLIFIFVVIIVIARMMVRNRRTLTSVTMDRGPDVTVFLTRAGARARSVRPWSCSNKSRPSRGQGRHPPPIDHCRHACGVRQPHLALHDLKRRLEGAQEAARLMKQEEQQRQEWETQLQHLLATLSAEKHYFQSVLNKLNCLTMEEVEMG
jgi:hypothetical protein